MTGRTSTIEGTPQLQAALRRAGAAGPQLLGRGLYQEAEGIMTTSKQSHVPVDAGVLKTSGFVRPPEARGAAVSVELGYGGAASAYAVYVHEGTGPAVGRPAFMPPVDVIRAWAKRHGIPEDAAFPIARAIGQRGLKPLKYLERPLLAAVRGMASRLAARIRGELARAAR